jgi:outer membrane immunogenic protein
MIRKVLLSLASGVALASSAFGADIYSPGPQNYVAVALPPVWSGFYLGVNGGFGGNSGIDFRDRVFFPGGPPPLLYPTSEYSNLTNSVTIAGGFGGGQVGYNFQAGNFVYGFEADIQGANIRGDNTAFRLNPMMGPNTPSCGAGVPFVVGGACSARNDLQVDYFGTVRGRLGYAFGGTLLYATGGFAYGGVRSTASYTDNSYGLPALPLNARISKTSTATGWVAGAGIEYKLSPSWSLKGEYQYVDLGSESEGPVRAVNGYGSSGYSDCALGTRYCKNLRVHNDDVGFHTVRVGLNYSFNTPYVPLK